MRVGRQNEPLRKWFRSDRVFLVVGQWYFHTREGVEVGPYDTRFEAEIEAGMLRELLRETQTGPMSMSVIREFVRDALHMGRPLSPQFLQGA